jgi:hypothetical protein
MNAANIIRYYFFKIHSSVILPSTPRSSKRSLPFRFTLYAFLVSPVHDTCPVHLHHFLCLYYSNICVRLGLQLLNTSVCDFNQFPVTFSLRSKHSPQHRVFEHAQPTLSQIVRDQLVVNLHPLSKLQLLIIL